MSAPHIGRDTIISDHDTRTNEKILNAYSFHFARILNLCRFWENGTRIKAALTHTNLEPPRLRFSMKDHEKIQPGQTVLPCRPLCAATESPNGQLSHLISIILNHLAEKMDQGTECRSTEELIAAFEEVNSHNGPL